MAHDTSAGADVRTFRQVTKETERILTASPRRHAAEAYLRQRGIDPAALGPEWVIGYAPPGWTRLVDTLSRDFDEQALLDAGVARRSSRGALIDMFRDRVVFGIRDTDGDVAGFIGRDLSGDPVAPKYLNTRQHMLFDKGRLLYGLREGTCGHDAGQPVVVEGPLDVLAIAARCRHSPKERLLPVAACETAFTPAHAQLVAGLVGERQVHVVVALDGDAAGRAAALAAGERLRRSGLDVRIATLPNVTDPAGHLGRAHSSLDPFGADNALPLLTVHVQHTIAAQGDKMQWIEGRLAAARNISRYLATYPAGYTARQIGWLAASLDLDGATVTFELADAYRQHSSARSPRCVDRPGRVAYRAEFDRYSHVVEGRDR